MTRLVAAPHLIDHGGYFGAHFKVGETAIFVFDIEEEADAQGRTVMTGHDDDGNEVEIHFFPAEEDDDE